MWNVSNYFLTHFTFLKMPSKSVLSPLLWLKVQGDLTHQTPAGKLSPVTPGFREEEKNEGNPGQRNAE